MLEEGKRHCSRLPGWIVTELVILRICPGRHFALRTMYLFVACVSAVFDIEPVLDEDGNPQLPEAEFTGDSIVRYVFLGTSIHTVVDVSIREPKHFRCTIKPRSEDVVKLVKETCDSSG